MNIVTVVGLTAAAGLAFANGANDISKSIATLVGSGESDYKKAVVVTSLAVAAGAVLASAWAVKMTLLFTKGMLSPQVQLNQTFALAILAGAVGWVLLSTRVGMPVSTTHAIVGATLLTGLYAFGFDQVLWGSVWKKVALPLLLSPVVAFGAAWLLFRGLNWLCREQYCLNCHWAHWASAVSSGFARGLNDTPKIAGLGFFFYAVLDPNATVAPRWFFLVLTAANAVGGIILGLKVTDTLAHKVTRMDHLEGFAANLATTAMVVATAVHGFPVSTTHVSSSAIMGMGLRKGTGGVNHAMIGQIALAWLVTLPTAGVIGVATYWTLTHMVLLR
ncbi:MAG: inorganic phosphate transporter [Elusimicrobiota bacterium]|nr:inorganic phosphate transporter [Elusimicrobiota bacterium]